MYKCKSKNTSVKPLQYFGLQTENVRYLQFKIIYCSLISCYLYLYIYTLKC